jgi:hypothetical protein
MRTTLTIVFPLIASVATVSLLFAAYQVQTEKRILRNDLSHQANILGESLQESVEHLFDRIQDKSIQRLVERFTQREHLKGVAIAELPRLSKARYVYNVILATPPLGCRRLRPENLVPPHESRREDIPLSGRAPFARGSCDMK